MACEQNHPWCRDVSRDEAIRAAEDAAERTPLPDHRDLPAAVAELRDRVVRLEAFTKSCICRETEVAVCAANPATDASSGEGDGLRNVRDSRTANGLRKERVTLEVTHGGRISAERWAWNEHLREALSPGESVRVAEDADAASDEAIAHGATLNALAEARESLAAANRGIDRLTAERDAALRERDAARADADHDVREVLAFARLERDAAKEECERLRARVAELEAAPAANAGVEDVVVVPQTVVAGNYAQIHWNTCCRLHRMAMDKAGVRWSAEFAFGSLDVGSNPLHTAPAANAGGEANCPAAPDSSPQPPRGWLTEEERTVVESLRATFQQNADALRSVGLGGHVDNWERKVRLFDALLARSTPPSVKVPGFVAVEDWHTRDRKWVAAIREAGGEVE